MRYSSWTHCAAMAVLTMIGRAGVCDATSYELSNSDSLGQISATTVTTTSTTKVKQSDCAFGNQCKSAPDRSTNVWVSADFLYWGACEDGFSCEFGNTLINTTAVNSIPTTAIIENDRDIDFDWEPGYRVGAGVDMPCSGWDTGAFYTYYYGKGSGNDGASQANWGLHFNVADAVVGRNFWAGSCVDLRPFAGVRYAQIKQNYDAHLVTNLISSTGPSVAVSDKVDTQKFWGFGPQLGLESDFYLGHGWSLYGNVDGAILYGHTKSTFNDSDRFDSANNTCLSTSNSCSNLWAIDAGVGVRWEFDYLTLKAGLEQHTYFDYNKIGCGGNLNLYGANISAAIHF